VYDRDNSSYLFNLNSDWVLDARQRGNKLRFANHSTTANCRAEILMVGGFQSCQARPLLRCCICRMQTTSSHKIAVHDEIDHRVAPYS